MRCIRSADDSVLPIGGPNATHSTIQARSSEVDGYDIFWINAERHYTLMRFRDGTCVQRVRVHEVNAHGEPW